MRRSLRGLLALVALVTCSLAPAARADMEAARCARERGAHVDVLTSTYSQACFGHVDHHEGRYVRTVVLPEPMSGDVRASRDVKSVVYVASYMSMTAAEALAQNPVVVRVYREGALKAEHRLKDLATAADLEASISHVGFTSHVGSIGADARLVLTTNTGARRVIDTVTGRLVAG